MKATRIFVVVLAVAAVGVAIAFTTLGGGDDDGGGGTKGDGGEQAGDVRVTFAYSPEKEDLLKPLIAEFNRQREEVGGKPVYVAQKVVASGEAEVQIARERLKPVLWSPASSLWGRLLNYDADRDIAPDDPPSIVRTPLVIAMWPPLARALGWPKQNVGFKQILDLAVDKQGWAKYGKPQFGQFKLGHTNPDFSTSGLSAVAAEYYAATGKREGLTVADIEKPAVRQEVKDVERSIVHYGDTTLFFADQMKKYGPAYASAVAMEETTLIEFNRGQRSRPPDSRLVALYPKEGTFFSDNPAITLDAPWVNAQQREGAKAFTDFLTERITPQLAARYGFRPADPAVKPVAPVDESRGVNPAEPKTVLSLPEPRVLDRLKRAWREDRKPANIMLVVDTSGSMSEENKLERAKEGLGAFLEQISPNDRIGLTSFNSDIFPLRPVKPFGETKAQLRSEVRDLFPDGETAVYDAADAGLKAIQGLKDDSRINAVVVLTDGEDNQSALNARSLARKLDQQARLEGRSVRVYTIAYGSQANVAALAQIAAASGGKDFQGDTEDIAAVYRQISSFF